MKGEKRERQAKLLFQAHGLGRASLGLLHQSPRRGASLVTPCVESRYAFASHCSEPSATSATWGFKGQTFCMLSGNYLVSCPFLGQAKMVRGTAQKETRKQKLPISGACAFRGGTISAEAKAGSALGRQVLFQGTQTATLTTSKGLEMFTNTQFKI